MRGRVALLLAVAITVPGFALTKAYSVEPVKAAWSAKAGPEDGVCQTITCSFDTPVYAEFFTGTASGQQYRVQLKLPGENGLVVAHGQIEGDRSHVWVKCSLDVDRPDSVIKGRTYEVRWTLDSGEDSLVYYYDSTDVYQWGQLVLPGQQALNLEPRDLACRVHGLMGPIDSTYWGSNALLPCDYAKPPDNAKMRHWWQQELEGKVDWGDFYIHWDSIQHVRFDSFYYAKLDTQLICMDSADVEPVACLVRCPKWASTRYQWYDDSTFYDTCVYCPPRGLWAIPGSGDTNLWAVYLESLVTHVDRFCGDSIEGIHTWEIWNEPNEGCTLSKSFPPKWPHYTGWWRPPNDDSSYPGVTPSAHDMCSLYVRLCKVADSVIRSDPDHEDDRIIIGAVSRVSEAIPWMSKVMGKWWVDTCYQVATRLRGPGVFWDGVSAHPYQYQDGFSEQLLEQDGADMRAVMRAHGHHDALLWNTELGWSMPKPSGSGTTEPVAAGNAAKSFTTSLAALGSPEGGFDRTCWWFSWEKYLGTWPLLRGRHSSSGPPLRQTLVFHAFRQSIEQLVGMRFNRRVLLGDARDDSVRLYEFGSLNDGRRTLVGWAVDATGRAERNIEVKIPLRSDRFEAVPLDYDDNPRAPETELCDNGWLSVGLWTRPIFVTETGPASRPDIRVDSVVVTRFRFGLPRATAWLSNIGNRPTPDHDEHPTEIVFFCDGDSAGSAEHGQPVYPGETVKVNAVLGPEFDRKCLVWATANPGQLYVELYGLDDNAGYVLMRGRE